MASSRLKSLTKLALLLGVPVALLLGLFGSGVYCGHTHRAAILGFERDWLGMDVGPLPVTAEPTPGQPVTKAAQPEAPRPVEAPKPEAPKPEAPKPEAPQPEAPQPEAPRPEAPKPVPAALTTVSDPVPLTLASTLPLPDELHGRMAEPVRVRVKVLVDPELVDRRPDWIAYVQRHVAWASQVLETQVGVRLELRGVVVWPGHAGTTAAAQLADLQRHSRDGADLLLGLSNRSFPDLPVTAAAAADFNAAHAVVPANPASRAPHLRGLLHAVGQSLGATAVTDATSEAWRAGSFMADLLAADSQPLALDADSRRRMLERKSLPFQPGPELPPDLDEGEL